ncbi:MAG: glycosyltransferase family 2 protein [Bacilli bacterium]
MVKKVSIIIPAHNEEKIIQQCIESILQQTYKDIHIIISCDNCTDRTAELAREYPVTVYKTVNNKGKRSGAINQAITYTGALDSKYIIAFDADSTLEPKAIEKAVNFLATHTQYASTCSFGKVLNTKQNFLTHMQNLEYGRFNTERIETQGRILVSHGLCSVFRTDVLRRVLYERGFIYDENNIIEDYELTQYIKHMGYKLSVNDFDAYTDVPEDFKTLYNQRKRWVYGSITVLKKYPITKHNILDRLAHIWNWIMIIISFVLTILIVINLNFNKIMLIVAGLSLVNSLIRIPFATWKNWKVYGLSLLILPEMIYNLFMTFIFVSSYYDYIIRKKLILKNDNYA